MKPVVSIIVLAKNEEKLIGKCLQSLRLQKSPYHFEIILVDTNSVDATLSIAKKYGVKIIAESRLGKGRARQSGGLAGRGDILAFTEADCLIPPDWLAHIVRIFKNDNQVVGVSGIYHLSTTISWLRFFSPIWSICSEWLFRLIYGHHSFRGTNFAVKKEIFSKTKGFDTKKMEFDDVDFSHRASKFGKITFDPSLYVTSSDRRFRGRLLEYLKEFLISYYQLTFKKAPEKIYKDLR